MSKLKPYVVEKGEKDFKPNNIPYRMIPRIFTRKMEIEFLFTDSAFSSVEDPDYPHGPNGLDPWLKVAGMTDYFTENDHNSMILAYRPAKPGRAAAFLGPDKYDPNAKYIELTAYRNNPDGSHKFDNSNVVFVPTGKKGKAVLRWYAEKCRFEIEDQAFWMDGSRPFALGGIHLWHGGQFPAHKQITVHLAVKFPIL